MSTHYSYSCDASNSLIFWSLSKNQISDGVFEKTIVLLLFCLVIQMSNQTGRQFAPIEYDTHTHSLLCCRVCLISHPFPCHSSRASPFSSCIKVGSLLSFLHTVLSLSLYKSYLVQNAQSHLLSFNLSTS